MAVTIQKRPNDRCWTGNPVFYQLYSAAALADPSIYFEISIWFKRRDEADFTEIHVMPYYPYQGVAKVDIRKIIDGLLEYELPGLGMGFFYENPLFSNKMTGHCFIKYREITVADPDPAWSTDAANERFVIKGGISYEKWRGNNYWVNYYDVVKPFLTWQQSGKLAGPAERMYLAWLNLTDVAVGKLMMRRKLVFTDGSESFAFIDCPVSKYDVIFFPCGADQLALADVNPDKSIWYWEMQVYDITVFENPVLVSIAHRYYLDNRCDGDEMCLNYRNSLGGLDSVNVRGIVEYLLTREFTEQERTVFSDYFINHFIQPQRIAGASTELLVYKGDVGFVGREEQDRLRDIHFQRECWQESQGKWLPVMLLTGNQKQKTSGDKIFSMPIEFAVGSGQDPYYTPRNVNLQEGNEETEPLCDAEISDPTWEFTGGQWVVSWNLTDGAPVKYTISTPGVSGGAPQNSIVTEFSFDWLPVGDNLITVTPVCLIGGVYYPGQSKQVLITVEAACVGAGWEDDVMPNPPNAFIGVPYNFSFDLTGTAPFTFTVESKPEWMMITIVGSTVTLSGTPEAGDVRESELVVSFWNCLFENELILTDTINTF